MTIRKLMSYYEDGYVIIKNSDDTILYNGYYDDIYPYLYYQQVISITSGLYVGKAYIIIYIDYEED